MWRRDSCFTTSRGKALFNVEQAIKSFFESKAVEKGVKLKSVLETKNHYIITVVGNDGYDIDDCPYAFNKETGEINAFFIPEHIDEFVDAKEIKNISTE